MKYKYKEKIMINSDCCRVSLRKEDYENIFMGMYGCTIGEYGVFQRRSSPGMQCACKFVGKYCHDPACTTGYPDEYERQYCFLCG